MKLRRLSFAAMAFGLFFLIALSGCDGGGGGGGDGQQTITSTLNGTFNGDITTTQDGRDSVDTVNLSLTVGSPLSGTFFRQRDGAVGTISGDAVDNSATFTGRSSGDCPASFDGSITLMDNSTISVSMEGSDCNGSFSSDGMLTKVECIDLSGTYDAEETVTATCTAQGESETVTMSGTGTVVIEQSGCSVSYVVPEFDVPRNGEIEGNNIAFTGPFAIPLVSGVNLTQNTSTIAGVIIDENEIILNGSGIATGTFEGISFSCTGDSTSVFTRACPTGVSVIDATPLLIGNTNPPQRTGVGALMRMQVSPASVNFDGVGITEALSPLTKSSTTCPEKFQRAICTSNNPLFTVGTGGRAGHVDSSNVFVDFGVTFQPQQNTFADQHFVIGPDSILDVEAPGVDTCQLFCEQIYFCRGNAISAHEITYVLRRGIHNNQDVTFVTATKN